jgi:hypothetical protein
MLMFFELWVSTTKIRFFLDNFKNNFTEKIRFLIRSRLKCVLYISNQNHLNYKKSNLLITNRNTKWKIEKKLNDF